MGALATLRPDRTCGDCNAYFAERGWLLVRPLIREAAKRGTTVTEQLVRYAAGVHARHLAGLSLDTRGAS